MEKSLLVNVTSTSPRYIDQEALVVTNNDIETNLSQERISNAHTRITVSTASSLPSRSCIVHNIMQSVEYV